MANCVHCNKDLEDQDNLSGELCDFCYEYEQQCQENWKNGHTIQMWALMFGLAFVFIMLMVGLIVVL